MIRRADINDIPELLRLLVQVNNVHADGRPDLFRHGFTKYTAGELKTVLEKNIIFADTADGVKLRGYAFCEPVEYSGEGNQVGRREIYIDDICVDESCRGNHIGTGLYEYVRDYARENGFCRITLNVWSLNPAAEAFYRSLGMKVYKLGMEELLTADEREIS